jgi:hypothetical protein
LDAEVNCFLKFNGQRILLSANFGKKLSKMKKHNKNIPVKVQPKANPTVPEAITTLFKDYPGSKEDTRKKQNKRNHGTQTSPS